MDRKTSYLIREFWILAWNASVQRAALYKNGAWENRRDLIDEFKAQIISYIKTHLLDQYTRTVGEQQHCANINALIEHANGIDSGILGHNKYKYGIAQKLLNLALKYYWRLGQITEPPHCPIDKIIIDKTICKGGNWTQILTESEYLEIISAVRSLAEKENCSIAQWELNNYERRDGEENRKASDRRHSEKTRNIAFQTNSTLKVVSADSEDCENCEHRGQYIIGLPYGGGGKFDACELVKHIRESGFIVQGQQAASMDKHTKPHSLDYWLRHFARNRDVKQAVNSVCQDLVKTGLFVEDYVNCPVTDRRVRGLRLVQGQCPGKQMGVHDPST